MTSRQAASPGGSSAEYVFAIAGNKIEVRRIFDEIEWRAKTEYVPYSDRALVRLGLGENQKAITELEMADRSGEPFDHMNVDRRFDPLRSDPRFLALLHTHGFSR